jgi:hypothetical protein
MPGYLGSTDLISTEAPLLQGFDTQDIQDAKGLKTFVASLPRRMFPLFCCHDFSTVILIHKLGDIAFMPQTPWTVPAGYYVKCDNSTVYLQGPSKFGTVTAECSGDESTGNLNVEEASTKK